MSESGTFDKKTYIDRLMGIFDAPVDTVNDPIAASELGWRFSLSEYGHHMMDDQPYRFEQHFGYDNARMEEDLGLDVLPVHHQFETAQYVTWIIEAELQATGEFPIEQEEVGLAVFAAIIHDMGESTHPAIACAVGATVGDIPAGEKTDHDRTVEAAVRTFLYGELYSDVDPAIIARIEAVISHQETSSLHDIVEAAHTLQTFATGVRAGHLYMAWLPEIIKARMLNEPLPREYSEVGQLDKLFNTVTERMVPLIRHLATRFAYVKMFAAMHENVLRAFELTQN